MTVLVTGATGTVGAHVCARCASAASRCARSSATASRPRACSATDVELAVGDFADRGSIDRALHGVERLFLACGNVPGQVEHECAAIDAARAAGVRRVVKLSGPARRRRLAAAVRALARRDRASICSAPGLPSVLLRPSAYMTNLLA